MTKSLSEPQRKLSPERRARILDAARGLILRHGLRATTMEAIAREARIAKPTLYGYFADKDAVFGALVLALIGDVRAAFDAAMQGEGDVVARIGTALAAKYKVIARLLEGSPHADELYSEHGSGGAGAFAGMDGMVEASIVAALDAAGVARPRQLAQLILAASFGIGRKAANPAEIGPAIRLLVERLVRPELG